MQPVTSSTTHGKPLSVGKWHRPKGARLDVDVDNGFVNVDNLPVTTVDCVGGRAELDRAEQATIRSAESGGQQLRTQGDMHGYSQDDGMPRQPMPNMTSTAHGESPAAASSHAAPREQRAGYRADIDGLRAVAVIAVIVFHLDESYLPGGFTGVDSFFVISGFVVSSSLLSRPAPSAAQLLLGFYSRRVRRLMPALVVTVLATAITISMVVPPEASGLDSYYASAQLALVGMANNMYAAQTTGYWERGQQTMEFNPFTHMWSLGVEGAWLHCKNPLQALAHIA